MNLYSIDADINYVLDNYYLPASFNRYHSTCFSLFKLISPHGFSTTAVIDEQRMEIGLENEISALAVILGDVVITLVKNNIRSMKIENDTEMVITLW